MIIENSTTLIIASESVSTDEISRRLGVAATTHHRPEDIRARIGKGSRSRPQPTTFGRWIWELNVNSGKDEFDGSGFESLKTLLDILTELSGALTELAERCELELSWVGFSDSSQGGFVLESTLASRLGEFDLPLYCTVYTSED